MQNFQMAGEKRVYISLGSNVGDRAGILKQALAAMEANGIHIVRQSSVYHTEPVDAPPQSWFLNAVVEAETMLMPRQLLATLTRIERTFGRRRTMARGPRTLDLDVLLYGTSVIHAKELEVPHPRMALRRFVLVPLAELAPALRHPVLQRTIAELLAETPDRGEVRRWLTPADTPAERAGR